MERTFRCVDGLEIAAQVYPAVNASKRILMLHGWLDNCRTFWKLAPALHNDDTEVVALDFPGHGLSGHKGRDGTPAVMAEAVYYVADVLQQQLQWEDCCLVGHSMGAGVSVMYAAAFPEQVEKLVLLEGIGPLPRHEHEPHLHLRAHTEKRLAGNQRLYGSDDAKARCYPSLETAVKARRLTALRAPGGNQYLSEEAATEIVARATTLDGDGCVRFRHDPRLLWPSLQYMTWPQVEALQKAVTSPTCLLLAEDGWPFDKGEECLENLRPVRYAKLEGSHHFHADPNHCDAVIQHIQEFLQDY